MAKPCELCEQPTRIYCESDRASLCWECDARVHGANFLVARHSRCLLCRSCQAPTPWRASGPRLGPTVSLCELCLGAGGDDGGGGCDLLENWRRDGEEEDEEEDEGDEDDDEEGDNQVVPLAMVVETTPMAATPPPVASCSSSEESSSGGTTAVCQALHDDARHRPPQRGHRRRSPPSLAVAHSGRTREEADEEATPSGGPFRAQEDPKTSTSRPPARVGSPGGPQHNRFPRGGSPTVDLVSQRSRSPPI